MYRVIQDISKNTPKSLSSISSNINNNLNIQTYNGITVYKDNIKNLDNLSKEELIFIYFMKKALNPLNKIYRNQEHRYLNDIIKLFKNLYHLANYNNLELSKSIPTVAGVIKNVNNQMTDVLKHDYLRRSLE
jgi:hypothetical protein